MLVKFIANGAIYSWREGQVKFFDGDECDLPEQKARELVKKFPQCFKLVKVEENKMMQRHRDK